MTFWCGFLPVKELSVSVSMHWFDRGFLWAQVSPDDSDESALVKSGYCFKKICFCCGKFSLNNNCSAPILTLDLNKIRRVLLIIALIFYLNFLKCSK